MATEFIAVSDETGGNRPIDRDDGSFGVGTIIYSAECEDAILQVADNIADILGKKDFKYKDVQKSTEARKAFLDMLNSSRHPTLAYSFYASGGGVAKEFERFDIASEHYEDPSRKVSDPNKSIKTIELFQDFIGKMACQLGAYAVTSGKVINCYWDRRNDIDILKNTWDKSFIDVDKITDRYSGAIDRIPFGGIATGSRIKATRLAGVLAGDVQAFFNTNGPLIWEKLDNDGIKSGIDTNTLLLIRGELPPVVGEFTIPLSENSPTEASVDSSMIGGYWKSFLKSDQFDGRLISFADPDGRYGVIVIKHGSEWSIVQLPD